MANVCVITGGGSGMGFEAARIIGKDQKIILVGRTVAKLENAINELKAAGIEAESFAADASDRESVARLVEFAKSKGTIKTVIHAAGVSPNMADALTIFSINAGGTIIIDEAFAPEMAEGGVILNVSSMSGYMLPADRIPYQLYQAALAGPEAIVEGFKSVLANVPDEMKTGMAYTMSKNFVQWFTEKEAIKYGRKGIRVVSISPGTFSTPMGKIEGEQAASFALNGALGRVGDPVEIAKMMAFMVSDDASYLTGTDILYDGGSVAAFKEQAASQQR